MTPKNLAMLRVESRTGGLMSPPKEVLYQIL